MKTYLYACAMLFVMSSAFAADYLPMPQSLNDLNPVVRQEALPAAPHVKVGIPQNRIAPGMTKSSEVMRIAPGKSQTVILPRDASSVIVGNPAHASVFLDNSRLLVVVPRAPGATSFTVLDKSGQTILNQQVLVTEKDDASYVRVTRICDGATGTCVPSTTYFCPDNCVAVAVPAIDANAAQPVIPAVAAMPPLPADTGSASVN